MKTDQRLGTYDEIRALVPAHAATLDAIRETMHRLDRDGIEVPSPGERSVWWSVAGNKMKDGYAYAMPHKAHVNLGFFQGARLPDPEGLLEGTGKTLRHVKIKAPESVVQPAVQSLIHAAIDERRQAVRAN